MNVQNVRNMEEYHESEFVSKSNRSFLLSIYRYYLLIVLIQISLLR